MFELVIKDISYPLNFGMGFVRRLDKSVNIPVDGLPGVKKDIGLTYAIMSLLDNDIVMLSKVIDTANEGQNPRLTQAAIDAYLEDEGTDIEELFNKILGFFKSANCTKRTAARVDAALKEVAMPEAETEEKI